MSFPHSYPKLHSLTIETNPQRHPILFAGFGGVLDLRSLFQPPWASHLTKVPRSAPSSRVQSRLEKSPRAESVANFALTISNVLPQTVSPFLRPTVGLKHGKALDAEYHSRDSPGRIIPNSVWCFPRAVVDAVLGVICHQAVCELCLWLTLTLNTHLNHQPTYVQGLDKGRLFVRLGCGSGV